MIFKPVFVVLSLFLALAASQTIQRIETKTADFGGSQMTFGEVTIEIFTPSGTFCRILGLDSSGNDFQQGAIDVFQGIWWKFFVLLLTINKKLQFFNFYLCLDPR